MRSAFVVLASVALTACTSSTQELSPQIKQNYKIGTPQTARVGDPIVSREMIRWVRSKEWVGILFSADGWKVTDVPTDDSFKEELIYAGKSGNTISISYREYKKEFARPAFFQELRYDLSQSQGIVFRSYKIAISQATNEDISYVVERDR